MVGMLYRTVASSNGLVLLSQVNLDQACPVGEQLLSATKFVHEQIHDTMKNNLQTHPTIKWQYFASEQGINTVYPAFKLCDDTYDPRFRSAIILWDNWQLLHVLYLLGLCPGSYLYLKLLKTKNKPNNLHCFRPWYVSTATPEPKDVVLVIDTSGSMKYGRMEVAIKAAQTVVNTLSPDDRVGGALLCLNVTYLTVEEVKMS